MYKPTSMENGGKKGGVNRNRRSLPNSNNKVSGRKTTQHDRYSSTSTSPGSIKPKDGHFSHGTTPALRLPNYRRRIDCDAASDAYTNEKQQQRMRYARSNNVEYVYPRLLNREVNGSKRPFIGNVVSLADGTISVSNRNGGNPLAATCYEGSSDSLESKTGKYGADGSSKVVSGTSYISSSDGLSDTTITIYRKSECETEPMNGMKPSRIDGWKTGNSAEGKMWNKHILHDISESSNRISVDVCLRHYLLDEYPALPGQADTDANVEGEGRPKRYGSCSSSGMEAESSSKLGCPETKAVMQTVSSVLMSTEDAFGTLVQKITPTKTCKANKMYLFGIIEKFLIQCLGDDTSVYLAGSTAYDIDIDYGQLSIPSYSDIDIEVISPRYNFNSRAILRKVYTDLCEMQDTLKRASLLNNWVIGNSMFKLVDSARVPIVIMRTKNGVLCDISANTANSLSHNKLFKRYIQKHPILRSIMRLIKHWLKFRGIPVMKEGGFPSILWMLLFCNVVETNDSIGTSNHGPKTKLSAIFELLNCKQFPDSDGGSSCTIEGAAPAETNELTSHLSILASLEKCFKVLSHGRNLIEMVSVVTCRNSPVERAKARGEGRWRMGDICANLIQMIEMEPNVPYGTWLVYYYELYRAEDHLVQYSVYLEMLVTLVVCLRIHTSVSCSGNQTTVSMLQLKVLVTNIKEIFGYDLEHLLRDGKSLMANVETDVQRIAETLGIKLDSPKFVENVRMLINHLIQKFSAIALSIFKDSYDKVYSVPVAIEPPTPLIVPQEHRNYKDKWSCVPMFEGTTWNDSGWFIVELSCKLYIIKAIKVCVDWESWWSMDFVSRRDTRTVYHGFVYRQIMIESDSDRLSSGNRADLPCVLLRKGGLVLFHPADIVSRLYVMKVMKHEQSISSHYYSFDMFTGARTLYVMPGFEAKRYAQFEQAAARLSKHVNPSMFRKAQRPQQCRHCGAITVSSLFVPNDYKTSQRKLKNLRYVICSPRYMEYYAVMQAGLRRVHHTLRTTNM